jgi:hypothetical protein
MLTDRPNVCGPPTSKVDPSNVDESGGDCLRMLPRRFAAWIHYRWRHTTGRHSKPLYKGFRPNPPDRCVLFIEKVPIGRLSKLMNRPKNLSFQPLTQIRTHTKKIRRLSRSLLPHIALSVAPRASRTPDEANLSGADSLRISHRAAALRGAASETAYALSLRRGCSMRPGEGRFTLPPRRDASRFGPGGSLHIAAGGTHHISAPAALITLRPCLGGPSNDVGLTGVRRTPSR